jgi:hypothetical protein
VAYQADIRIAVKGAKQLDFRDEKLKLADSSRQQIKGRFGR